LLSGCFFIIGKGGEKRLNVLKAYAISDAKIQFVSLVDKAANKRRFIITKAEDGEASFQVYGRIVKTDSKHHYVTGIVYEPMVEDSDGNYMTEEEITKAAYWFAKNGDKVDLQHSFETLENAKVVETWIAKADFSIGDEKVKKGSWLITVEISDNEIWDKIEKGEITGFSMGGVGKYSDKDVDLSAIEKQKINTGENKSIFKKLASAFGFDIVEKGAVADKFKSKTQSTLFWNAWYSLQETLSHYDWTTDKQEFETDEDTIREALQEFSEIVIDVLAEKSVTKALTVDLPVEKAGKPRKSNVDHETLQKIYKKSR